jgi:hypothetical protein
VSSRLRAELAALTTRIAALERVVRGPQLLHALAAAVEDRAFSAAEVIAHARLDPGLATALETSHIHTARSLGQYLWVASEHPMGPIRVTRLGVDRDGVTWRVTVVW